MPSPQRTNERWSMDFVTDSIVTGRRFRALAIVDDYSRECLVIEVDTSLGGRRVVSVLVRLAKMRELPEFITVDNGPEFSGRALDEWACRKGVKLSFIRPGKPIENGLGESFIGRLRDECLNTEVAPLKMTECTYYDMVPVLSEGPRRWANLSRGSTSMVRPGGL